MKERGIIFNTEMVKAIIDGRKTQTRRPIKPQPVIHLAPPCNPNYNVVCGIHLWKEGNQPNKGMMECSPFGQIGDILYVRETWHTTYNENNDKWDSIYKADSKIWIDEDGPIKWKPSIHMPKTRARIFLEIINIRVEKLKGLTEEDAIKEGFKSTAVLTEDKLDYYGLYAFEHFAEAWNNIYNNWYNNPWVWIIEFKRIK